VVVDCFSLLDEVFEELGSGLAFGFLVYGKALLAVPEGSVWLDVGYVEVLSADAFAGESCCLGCMFVHVLTIVFLGESLFVV
jgi:hypothetical protein